MSRLFLFFLENISAIVVVQKVAEWSHQMELVFPTTLDFVFVFVIIIFFLFCHL